MNNKNSKLGDAHLQDEERALTQAERNACQMADEQAERATNDQVVAYINKYVNNKDSQCINPHEFAKRAHLGVNLLQRLNKSSTITDLCHMRLALGIVIFSDILIERRILMKAPMPTPDKVKQETDKMRTEFRKVFGKHATKALTLKQQGADLDMMARYYEDKSCHNKNVPQNTHIKKHQALENNNKKK